MTESENRTAQTGAVAQTKNNDNIASPLSRRDMLRATALAGGALFLAACDTRRRPPAPTPSLPTIEPHQGTLPAPEQTEQTVYAATPQPAETSPGTIERIVIDPAMREAAEGILAREYDTVKRDHLVEGKDEILRAIHEPSERDSSMEMQGIFELLALFQGDYITLENLMYFDDRVIFQKQNGLKKWRMDAQGEVKDESAVADTMITQATARLLSPFPRHNIAGVRLIKAIRENLVNQQTNIIRLMDSPEWDNKANISYWSPWMLELFAKYDPEWNPIIQSSREFTAKVREVGKQNNWAFFPQTVDMSGNATTDARGNPPSITYDTARIPLFHMLAARFSTDPETVEESMEMLRTADNFYYGKIRQPDGRYDIDMLKDGYMLDGSLAPGQPFSKTAWASAAVVASQVSPDPSYRQYMAEQFPTFDIGYPNNAYMKMLAAQTLTKQNPLPGVI